MAKETYPSKKIGSLTPGEVFQRQREEGLKELQERMNDMDPEFKAKLDTREREAHREKERLIEEEYRDNPETIVLVKRILEIYRKYKIFYKELTRDDLRFIYDLDGEMNGIEINDARLTEILEDRNHVMMWDLMQATGLKSDQISITEDRLVLGSQEEEIERAKEEASFSERKSKFHYGDINLRELTSAKDLHLPESMVGNLFLSNLTSVEGLVLPKTMRGNIDLSSLDSVEGLNIPDNFNGIIYLKNSAELKYVNGELTSHAE